jgi:hypothetical protein
MGPIERPVLQECGEQSVLDRQRDILPGPLLGPAVSEEIVEEDPVAARQLSRDGAPDEGREGRTVDKDDRIASPNVS